MNARLFLVALATMICASPIFAQTGTTTSGITGNLTTFGAVLAMALGSGLCGLGQGRAISGAAEGMARNPGAAAAIRGALILGLILIESLALYVFVIILLRT